MFSVLRHDELKAMIDRNDAMTILDIREANAFLKEHLPGAINIPLNDENFDMLVEKMIPEKSIPVIVYCGTREDQSSAEVAQKLAAMGYKNVSDYENGLKEWTDMGYELGE